MVSHIVRVVSIDAHTARKIQPRDKKNRKFCHPTRLRIPSPEIVTIIFVFIPCILWLVVGTSVPHRINHTKQEKNTDKYFTIMNLYGFFSRSLPVGKHLLLMHVHAIVAKCAHIMQLARRLDA